MFVKIDTEVSDGSFKDEPGIQVLIKVGDDVCGMLLLKKMLLPIEHDWIWWRVKILFLAFNC